MISGDESDLCVECIEIELTKDRPNMKGVSNQFQPVHKECIDCGSEDTCRYYSDEIAYRCWDCHEKWLQKGATKDPDLNALGKLIGGVAKEMVKEKNN